MNDVLSSHISDFAPISLDELNGRAALLDREENKYVITMPEFMALISKFRTQFDILTIDDKTIFSYKSTYFDSSRLIGYTYHNQGRTKRRFKVRTREYVDSGLCFFEVKLKNKRGGTIKKRIPYSLDDYGTITPEAGSFLRRVYQQTYNERFSHRINPQMEVNYSRITLVAKAGGERMTIDFNLEFKNPLATTPIRSMIIVETKSSTGRGIADAIFRRQGIKSRSCSKFCLGANLLEYKVKYNRFKPLLKMYHSLPLYSGSEDSL